MRSKHANRYSNEVKQAAIKQILNGTSSSQVARETGITQQSLNTWVKDFQENNAFSSRSKDGVAIKKLLKENKRLKEERDILKKAITFFTKEGE